MARHLVVRPDKVVETLDQFKGARVVVLSARAVVPEWKATEWFYSENLDTLCKRFRELRARRTQATKWVVVVDMLDYVPQGKGYNKLFKKSPDVNIVTVSEDKHVLRDHRFENCELKTEVYTDFSEEPAAAAEEEPKGWFKGWLY
jgi:hypothetical protein